MRTRELGRERTLDPEDARRFAMLATALRIIGIVNDLRLQEQRLTVTCAKRQPLEVDFIGQVPFAFAFSEGHEATFRVPNRHRFVIEHVTVSSPAASASDVQMVTRSKQMFRQMTLTCSHAAIPSALSSEAARTHTVLVPGSTSNTLLFSNGIQHSSFIVPANTYVQLWGYLEPTEDPSSS